MRRPTAYIHSLGIFLLLASSGSASAASIEEVLAPARQATSECHEIEGQHACSSQARALYNKEGLAKTLNLEPVSKSMQSFECKGEQSTAYLYTYTDAAGAKKAESGIKTYIWGGSSRSSHHPEYIFTVDNVVVVVSGAKPKHLANLLGATK